MVVEAVAVEAVLAVPASPGRASMITKRNETVSYFPESKIMSYGLIE